MSELVPRLGRLAAIDLRAVWKSEPYSFTPWLAQPENLAMLAEALGLPGLELVATEQRVSEFSVDIVARISGSDDLVAIENQLERSDHLHLGQCITYAAGTDSKAVVWIARELAEGHRAALDWLNRKTTDDIAFFGIEVSAVKIGNSEPAPQFNVVARPNDWARLVRDSANAQSLGTDNLANLAYWSAFDEVAEKAGVRHGMAKLTKGTNYYHYFYGDRKVGVCAYIARSNNRIGVYVFDYRPGNTTRFQSLEAHRSAIENEFGEKLDWECKQGQSWITLKINGRDPDNQSDWSSQHSTLSNSMAKLKAVFEPKLKIEA